MKRNQRAVRQRGNVLLILLILLATASAYLVINQASLMRQQVERDQATMAVLAQAREALIGFAAAYRETHGGTAVQGYLPCPDTNNDGVADPPCGGADVSVIGRLPWRTLGLPLLRDSANECLWYVVSGRGKDNPPTTISTTPGVQWPAGMTWDTLGQIDVRDASGAVLAGSTDHNRALAAIIAPRGYLAGANTAARVGGATPNNCGGNNAVRAYLDQNLVLSLPPNTNVTPVNAGPVGTANVRITLTLGTSDSNQAAANNDLAVWISADDLFGRIRNRAGFATDIQTLADDIKVCLDNQALPAASTANKGMEPIYQAMIAASPSCKDYSSPGTRNRNMLDHWRSNFLYAKPTGAVSIRSYSSCNTTPMTLASCSGGILFFAGSRGAGQSRGSAPELLNTANYLEGLNTGFPTASLYEGNPTYSSACPGKDVYRCLVGNAGATQVSFANNFGSFVPTGNGVSTTTVDGSPAVKIDTSTGGGGMGGCFWYPVVQPLSGKNTRAFYQYQFLQADTHALTSTGPDLGYGLTFSLLRSDLGAPNTQPAPCGQRTRMGAFYRTDTIGSLSQVVETDIHQDSSNQDPAQNHTAIMANGETNHSLTGTPPPFIPACSTALMTTSVCRHSPANLAEESPTPGKHNQRIEIASGCNASCSTCSTTSPAGSYVKVKVWVDCTDCRDTTVDFAGTPSAQRCMALPPEMNNVYFGFTAGFTNGSPGNGVIVSDFVIRSQAP